MFRSDTLEFVQNPLQKRSIGTIFGKWLIFKYSLSLWELQVIRD